MMYDPLSKNKSIDQNYSKLFYAKQHVLAGTEFVYLKRSWDLRYLVIQQYFLSGKLPSSISSWDCVKETVQNKYLDLYSLNNSIKNDEERKIETLMQVHDLIEDYSVNFLIKKDFSSLDDFFK